MQTTLKAPVKFVGTGLHSGRPVRMTLKPAASEFGIWFHRTDVTDRDAMVPAIWDAVVSPELCTRIRNDAGVEVSTIEHVMAAIAGTGLHNVLIELDGPEVPILDGSAAAFVKGILTTGVQKQSAPVRVIEVLETVSVHRGDAMAQFAPHNGLVMDFEIDFADRAIGHQAKSIDLHNGSFVHQLCDSRTFCRKADVDMMREKGLIMGGSMENAIVVDGDRVLSPGGLRHGDEPVRHKMLDALGDIALAGAPILGRYTGVRAGHAMTNLLLRALFATPGAFVIRDADPATEARLPGVGLSRSDAAQLVAA